MPRLPYFNCAFQIHSGRTGNEDAIAIDTAAKSARSFGELPIRQSCFAQTFRPIGRQSTLRRTSRGIFVDAAIGREKTADKICGFPRRSNNESAQIEVLQTAEVWLN